MKRRAIPMTLAIAALLLGGCTLDAENEPSSTEGPRGRVAPNDGAAGTLGNDVIVPGDAPQDWVDDGWWDGNDSLTLDILDARLTGAVGPVGSLSHQASETTSYADGYWTSLTVTVDKEGSGTGAAMAILDLEGNILALPGGTYELAYAEPRDGDGFTNETQTRSLYIIGCSGDDPGEWSFDQPADDGEIVVDDSDPDVLSISFEASFSNGSVYDWETGVAREVGSTTVTGVVHIAR